MTDSAALTGKTMVVTGAARGLGAAIARAAVARGATVVVTDILADELAETVAELGASARGHVLDVTDPTAWSVLGDRLRDEIGRPDVLVNNAGIVTPASLEETTHAGFVRELDVNLVGPFLGITKYVELHRATGCERPGSIVNISSARGLVAGPGVSAYVASKFGLRGLTKAAALELGGLGIRVNAVCPGPIESDMSAGNRDFPNLDWEAYVALLPLRRFGRPLDVAEAVCWLGSDASAFVTGIDLPVDGGLTAVALSPRPRDG